MLVGKHTVNTCSGQLCCTVFLLKISSQVAFNWQLSEHDPLEHIVKYTCIDRGARDRGFNFMLIPLKHMTRIKTCTNLHDLYQVQTSPQVELDVINIAVGIMHIAENKSKNNEIQFERNFFFPNQ